MVDSTSSLGQASVSSGYDHHLSTVGLSLMCYIERKRRNIVYIQIFGKLISSSILAWRIPWTVFHGEVHGV